MLVPPEHLFSVKDFYRMAEAGILRPDARLELLNGKIFEASPIGPFHGGLVNRLIRLFATLSRGRWQESAQNPLRIDDRTEPQPDFMLLKPAPDDYTSHHPGPDDVFLLVEVSDSTLNYDREEKLPAYGRAGVTEVWIVNLNNSSLEAYRDPHFTGYGSKIVWHPGDKVAPQAFPDAVLEVADLLRR